MDTDNACVLKFRTLYLFITVSMLELNEVCWNKIGIWKREKTLTKFLYGLYFQCQMYIGLMLVG